MTSSQFNIPSSTIIGGGVSGQVAAQAVRLGGRRALLVTDAHMVATGLAQQCVDRLAGCSATIGFPH